ncbi:MAG: endonuclease [Lachnospiraceae bacterium]|nr:endonuclease [Lachnospiraceae bacterium]
MKKVIKFIGGTLGVILLAAALFIGVLTVTEYKPAEREILIEAHDAEPVIGPGDSLTIASLNCGYGALGDNADFFMDGGRSVYTADRERLAANLSGITETLKSLDADVIFMQEVDIDSSRSYGTDERTYLRDAIDGADECFAYNFKVLYVPYPLPPIGRVNSGLYALSSYEIDSAERISLPCPFKWPIRTANLKRGLEIMRIPLKDTDKELVLVNLHLEAFDNGEGKIEQTKKLASILTEEAGKGNYVIAGGDFNQTFSDVENPYPVYEGEWQAGLIDKSDFPDDLAFYMDSSAPSCRSLSRAYAGESADDFPFFIIDGFIVSSNVKVDSMETISKDFLYTDHNPIRLKVTLDL